MFVIIEGSDCAGKTTLVNHLRDKFKLPIVKFSKPRGEPYAEYAAFLCQRYQPAILDRFYLGELVYGPLWRGQSGLDELQRIAIEDLLVARKPLAIYCETSIPFTQATLRRRGDEFTKADEIPAIIKGFRRAIAESKLDWFKFDYRADGDYRYIDKVVEEWLHEQALELAWRQHFIPLRTRGDLGAEILFVGERCNESYDELDYAVPFAAGPAAKLLIPLLQGRKYALTNALKVHLREETVGLPNELGLPNLKVVACLGDAAYDVVRSIIAAKPSSYKFDVIKLHHPSYVARFKRGVKQYKETLCSLT